MCDYDGEDCKSNQLFLPVTMEIQYTWVDKTSYGSSYSQWRGQQSSRSSSVHCTPGCISSWLGDRYCDHVRHSMDHMI